MYSSDDEKRNSTLTANKSPIGRTMKKEFIVSEEKLERVPRGQAIRDLEKKGRIRVINLNTAWTADMLFDQLNAVFPCLAGTNKNQLRFFKSIEKGNSFERIANSVPGGKELAGLTRGTSSKRVWINVSNKDSTTTTSNTSKKTRSPFSASSFKKTSQPQTFFGGGDAYDFETGESLIKDERRYDHNTSSDDATSILDGEKGKQKIVQAKPSCSSLKKPYHDQGAKRSLNYHETIQDSEAIASTSANTEVFANAEVSTSYCISRENNGEGLVVGELTEKYNLISIVEESAGTIQHICDISGGLLVLPDSFEEACQQALHLNRCIMFLVGDIFDYSVRLFLRNLNVISKEVEPKDFPLLVFAKKGSTKAKQIHERFTVKGVAKVIMCYPDDMELHCRHMQNNFNVDRLQETAAKWSLEALNSARAREAKRKLKQPMLLQDPHASDEEEVVFKNSDDQFYQKGDDSTIIIQESKDEKDDCETKEKEREEIKREKKEEQEKIERKREKREGQEKRERKRKKREEQEKRERKREKREEQEKRERKREKREEQEKRERKRAKREEQQLKEREEKEREIKENQKREKRKREKREKQEKKERKIIKKEKMEKDKWEHEEKETRDVEEAKKREALRRNGNKRRRQSRRLKNKQNEH